MGGEGSELSAGLSAAEYMVWDMRRKLDVECEKIVSRPYSYGRRGGAELGNLQAVVRETFDGEQRFEKGSMDC